MVIVDTANKRASFVSIPNNGLFPPAGRNIPASAFRYFTFWRGEKSCNDETHLPKRVSAGSKHLAEIFPAGRDGGILVECPEGRSRRTVLSVHLDRKSVV